METWTNLATSLAKVVAVGISLFVLNLQLQDRRQTRREKNREKPSQVSCWADWDPENEIKALSGAVLRSPCVIVTNQSNEPVFGAFIEYRNQNDDQPARVDVGTIPAGATKKVSVSEPFETPANWVPAALLPTTYFRDTRNRSWYRNTVGYLTRDPVLGAE